MNLMKKILPLTLFLFLIITIISPFNVINASSGTMNLSIKMERSSGYGYQLANSIKNIWKIYDTGNDRNYTIYCLKGGPGFGSNDIFNATPVPQAYTHYFDMRHPENIPDEYKKYYSGSGYVNILPDPDSQAYKSIMWILDNCFILPERNSGEPVSSDITTGNTKRDNLISAAKAYAKQSYDDAKASDFDKLTDDDIDVVQQLAIWYYTNQSGEYHVNDTFELWLNTRKGDVTQTNTYRPLSERNLFTNGEARAKACQGLFYYLIETPKELDYDYKNANNRNQTVQINDSEATMEVSNDRYIFGPYKLEKTGIANFELTGKVTYGTSDTVAQDVKYLNEGKSQVPESTQLSDLIGKKFYISLPNTIDYSKVKFSITGKYYTTEANYWSVETPEAKDQPVVKIEEKENTFTDETVFTPGEFDLALRKFITKIGSKDIQGVDTREPKISTDEISKLATKQGKWDNGTTAEKVHPKDPLPVKTGDIVRYKIRIYNEGEIAGYATEVTDYLPDGLEFITPGSGEGQSTVNQTYGWHVDSDAKIVKTSYLAERKINAFNGQELKYEDLEIECKVVAKAGETDSELKNIAEITAHKDEYGNTTKAKDRDSIPNNVQRDTYQTTSQQDDDDFERLVLSKVTLGKYELELEKVDSHDTSKKLQGVEFHVAITGGNLNQNNDYTTDAQGKINITDIQISEKETHTITITETKAPAGYSNQEAKIVITVQTDFENGGYIVKSISSTGTIKQGATNSTELKGYTAELQGSKIVVKMKNYQLDLALRKFITTIDGTDVKNDGESTFAREPKITEVEKGKLANGEGKWDNGTTAEKVHPKDPLQVHTGSRVIYTIRVYNEGEIAGYAKKVTDYLPEGLKFIAPGTGEGQSQINQTYGWTNPTEDGRTIETNHIANTLIDAFDGSNLDYEDLKIECEVVTKPGETETQLKNIAEITEHSDEYGDTTVTDRDSVPHNVTTNNYGETSQQDDDDFERLILEKATGKYNLELEKVDGQNLDKKLANAEFEITLPDGTTNTYTSTEQGKITINDLPITQLGEQIITIKETKAPSGYSKSIDTITVKVTPVLEEGEYIVKTIEIDENSIGNTLTEVTSGKTELKANVVNGKIYVQMKNYKLDLALRKFIISIAGNAPKYSREPVITNEELEKLANGTASLDDGTTANKVHSKEPLIVETGDKVIYIIRVYNEGKIAGYATKVTDYLPEGLKFLPESQINKEYGWTNPNEDGRTIETDHIAETLIDAFDGKTLDYEDLKVECEVVAEAGKKDKSLKNIAEITEHSDEHGDKTVEDIDSTPDNVKKDEYEDKSQEDDDDFEELILSKGKFDLALRKFITKVNDTDITNRVPVFKKLSETEFKYEHPKDPVQVAYGNIVTYTLRIFNEGELAGYASKIKDDLPEGLTFLPDNATNVEYRWKMYTEEGVETDNVEEAKYIETDYLAKENEKEENANLLKAFDQETMTMPDYRDIKIAFRVSEPNTSDRIIINTAEITDDRDEHNEPVDDVDSTPDNDEPDEDDIDEEKVKVQYFDLSLKKWVSESIVTYGGKTTVTKTGHTGDENPEPPAKVEIRGSRIDKTTVKFKFVIKVTNEGEIAGYAKELIDYIPEGLKFDPKDNPLWREEDGKVLTDQLKDTLLQPGESAEVEIILTWINNKNNLGEKVNWAEIYKDDNEPHSPDIDSEPGNNKPEEDDIDDAPVILAVVTGSTPTYVGLVIIAVSILAGGVVLIRKFVI